MQKHQRTTVIPVTKKTFISSKFLLKPTRKAREKQFFDRPKTSRRRQNVKNASLSRWPEMACDRSQFDEVLGFLLVALMKNPTCSTTKNHLKNANTASKINQSIEHQYISHLEKNKLITQSNSSMPSLPPNALKNHLIEAT